MAPAHQPAKVRGTFGACSSLEHLDLVADLIVDADHDLQRGGPVATTEYCDLWTFDEEGRVTDLVQFLDTAKLAKMLE